MPGSFPDREVRGPGFFFPDLGHAAFSHSMRPWMFRFKLVLIVHFLSVCVSSASGERLGQAQKKVVFSNN